MIKEIKAPSPGESVSEVEIATWLVEDGDIVMKDQEIAEIESEKATLPLVAEDAGQIRILKTAGEAVPVGEVLCTIDTSKGGEIKKAAGKAKTKEISEKPAEENKSTASKVEEIKSTISKVEQTTVQPVDDYEKVKVTPVARKMMEDNNLSVEDVIAGLRKISRSDIEKLMEIDYRGKLSSQTMVKITRDENRLRMSSLRRKLSERLVAVKNETAMLTTFNEADMSRIIFLRKKYQEEFLKLNGIKLGFMSFFTKAASVALRLYPIVNSRIEGEEIITPEYCDIGIAVQTDKGLTVPVIRNAETLTISEIEKEISVLAEKARNNRISIEEMKGGTFTITNGGIFGSLMSTPILNPPQAAILGMHNIIERPVVEKGHIVIRPMMYLALSYDHRVIDGRDSVGFLVKIKELIENPEKMLFNGSEPERTLIGL